MAQSCVVVLLSLGVEFVEWMASLWGVQRRGGSAAAGMVAVSVGAAVQAVRASAAANTRASFFMVIPLSGLICG